MQELNNTPQKNMQCITDLKSAAELQDNTISSLKANMQAIECVAAGDSEQLSYLEVAIEAFLSKDEIGNC